MRRVVVTGMGIISSLGTNQKEVAQSLRESRSGIAFSEEARDNGLRSHVAGKIDLNLSELIDRKIWRFMSPAAGYCYLAAKEAIAQAGITDEQLRANTTGAVFGTGGASTVELLDAIDTHRDKGLRRVGPYRVPRTMGSAINASITTAFGITGINYGITSACATSAHCIGHAADQIALGRQDVMLAGGGEDIHWTLSLMFDAMGALSTKYNDTPELASRTYDADRDGFVISGGGGALLLESLEHAEARGATILAELVGFGATSDGADMVAPSGEGAIRCMKQAMANIDGEINYVNTHGTSTPAGDVTELKAMKETFGDKIPPLSSTKPLCGHALGAAGVHEAIYSLIMQRENFIAPSANIQNLDEGAVGYPIVRERMDNQKLDLVMSNSF
ncbi:MAG TPA: beta-ketoacyl synthase N-terminal-like domain-containing protein, partial [Marinobacter sp.]|nr:beta-ketoacyl synthase N-terminal-like domain-containing protein [Marinobacter sp.]